MTAPLLAAMLCLLAAGPAVAADDGDEVVISVGQSDSLGVVSTAQSDGGTDADAGTNRRLVGRESGERVDAVVIALWTIAGVMTVLLGIFLWHTSPRRRLRLAGASAELFDEAVEEPEAAGRAPGEDSDDGDSAEKDFFGTMWERTLAWTRSWGARPHRAEPVDAESVDDGSEQESDGDSEDESAVWKFGEKDGEERSV